MPDIDRMAEHGIEIMTTRGSAELVDAAFERAKVPVGNRLPIGTSLPRFVTVFTGKLEMMKPNGGFFFREHAHGGEQNDNCKHNRGFPNHFPDLFSIHIYSAEQANNRLFTHKA